MSPGLRWLPGESGGAGSQGRLLQEGRAGRVPTASTQPAGDLLQPQPSPWAPGNKNLGPDTSVASVSNRPVLIQSVCVAPGRRPPGESGNPPSVPPFLPSVFCSIQAMLCNLQEHGGAMAGHDSCGILGLSGVFPAAGRSCCSCSRGGSPTPGSRTFTQRLPPGLSPTAPALPLLPP